MTSVPATSDFVRDAIFISNSPIPDVIASIRLVALIPARQIGLRVLYFGAGMDAKDFLDRHRPCGAKGIVTAVQSLLQPNRRSSSMRMTEMMMAMKYSIMPSRPR